MTAARPHRSLARPVMLASALAFFFVLVPFLFWHQTWFGRRLTDTELSQYLEQTAYGRRVQHAVVDLSERMVAGDASARKWYPGLIRASRHSDPAVRNLAAWAMGQDPASPALHDALRAMLDDPDLQVRRNAALSLVRFGDAAGRRELVAMLQPREVRTGGGGIVRLLVRRGQEVSANTTVATVKRDDGAEERAAAPLGSEVATVFVSTGVRAAPGDRLISLAPRQDDVWEALRALYYIGEPADLPAVERYAEGVPGMPERIRQQAQLTAEAIRKQPAPIPNP